MGEREDLALEFTYSNDGFLPYESFDYIYNDRVMPEFGKVVSPYHRPLTTWKFYLAHGDTEIPFGVTLRSFDRQTVTDCHRIFFMSIRRG